MDHRLSTIVLLGSLVFLLIPSFSPRGEPGAERHLIVQTQSTITIDGKTNVNKFQCTIGQYTGGDTLVLAVDHHNRAVFTKGRVNIAASAFDCGMKAITRDFTRTIHAEEHPIITIEFVSFERAPEFSTAEERLNGKVSLSLASVTKSVTIKCVMVKDDQGRIHLRGAHDFKFSDFQLVPPRRVMGVVRVDENIKVNFHLVLREA